MQKEICSVSRHTDDFAVINRDYPASNESDVETDGKVFYVSRREKPIMAVLLSRKSYCEKK